MEIRTLPGVEFLRLLLRHVLPKGFRRVRNFGFLHPNSKGLIQLLPLLFRIKPWSGAALVKKRPSILCPCCGGVTREEKVKIGQHRPNQAIAIPDANSGKRAPPCTRFQTQASSSTLSHYLLSVKGTPDARPGLSTESV